ncbi:unnamed protein product, partial [Symbiodinium sp. KB8]
MDQSDYQVVATPVWKQFTSWYKVDGPTLPREVVEVSGEHRVDVYPQYCKVTFANSKGEPDASTTFDLLISRYVGAEDAIDKIKKNKPAGTMVYGEAMRLWAKEGDDYKLLPSQISIGDASAGQSTLELL